MSTKTNFFLNESSYGLKQSMADESAKYWKAVFL